MKALEHRLKRLEWRDDPDDGRPLPVVLDDDAPQSEIDDMRAAGIDAWRFSDSVEQFI